MGLEQIFAISMTLVIVVLFIAAFAKAVDDRRKNNKKSSNDKSVSRENFVNIENYDNSEMIMIDKPMSEEQVEDELVMYDKETNSIMTGSDFMNVAGAVTTPWIQPAWHVDVNSANNTYGDNAEHDYENDGRMIYNKCSLSCCSTHKNDILQCDDKENGKYMPTNYLCSNDVSGTGCICLTKKQAEGKRVGFINYE